MLKSDGFESHFYTSPIVKETKRKLNQTRGEKTEFLKYWFITIAVTRNNDEVKFFQNVKIKSLRYGLRDVDSRMWNPV